MIVKAPPQQVPLGGGLRTDIDPKLLPLGNVLELENARQLRTGEIIKRFGTNALTNAVNSSVVSTLTQPAWQLANYKADLIRIQQQGKEPITRWSPALGAWAFTGFGDYTNLEPTIQSCLRGPFSSSCAQVSSLSNGTKTCDVAVSSGYIFYSVTENMGSNASHVLHVMDQATGKLVWRWTATAGTLQFQRICVVGGFLVMCWVDSTTNQISVLNLTISTLANATPTWTVYTGVGATAHATQPWLDMIAFGSVAVIAWRSSAAKTLGAEFTPSNGTHVNYEIKTSASASIPAIDALGFLVNNVGYNGVALATCDHTGVGVQVTGGFQGAAGGISVRTNVLDAAPGTTVTNITGILTTANSEIDCNVLYSLSSTGGPFGTASDYVKSAEFEGGIAFAGIWCRSIRCVSKMFTMNGDNFVMTGYSGQAASYNGMIGTLPAGQSTYFVHRVPLNMLGAPESPSALITTPIARLMPLDADVGPNNWLVSVVVSGSVAYSAANRVVRRTVQATSTTNETQAWSVTLTANPTLGNAVEAGDCLYVPGAQLQVFDGQNYADDGFAVFPEQPIVTSAAGGSMTPAGIYNVLQVYRYTDAQGRVDWSAPSLPTTVTISAGQGSIAVTFKPLNLTSRELNFGTSIAVETYRTGNINTGSPANVYQLLRTDANDPTQDGISYTDGTADTNLSKGQPLYTSGGVLQNDGAPGFSSLATFDGRLWGASMDFTDELWFTDQISAGGTSPRWSFDRTIPIQDEHGAITAIKALDDKLVVFKRNAVYIVTGSGPDPTGANANYNASLIAIGIGTSNPQSVCVVGHGSPGIAFQSNSSRAGYFLLDRGASLTYIGSQVQTYFEAATAAVLVPGQSQVRFYTASGRTLVYDLVGQFWSTYTGQPTVHATCWGDSMPAYARSATADVVVEDPTGATWQEAGVDYGIRCVTPWIQLSSLAGFERLFRIIGVGQTVGTHMLRVRLYKDFDDTDTVNDQWVMPGPVWDWEMRFSTKLSALKVALDEQRPMGVAANAGPNMSALALIMGVKAGLKKLSSLNRTT